MRPLRPILAALATSAALALSAPAGAQDFGRLVSPILTLDRDRLFAETLYGQRISRELEAATEALAAETRAIEAALEAEEQALTDQRASLTAEEFRPLATAFDEKVQALRAEREAADVDQRAQIDAARSGFFQAIGPVLGTLLRDRGAVLIVDRRAVLLAASDIDITPDAVARIDAVLGDGTAGAAGPADPAPEAAPVGPDATPDAAGQGAGGAAEPSAAETPPPTTMPQNLPTTLPQTAPPPEAAPPVGSDTPAEATPSQSRMGQ